VKQCAKLVATEAFPLVRNRREPAPLGIALEHEPAVLKAGRQVLEAFAAECFGIDDVYVPNDTRFVAEVLHAAILLAGRGGSYKYGRMWIIVWGGPFTASVVPPGHATGRSL
jgi:hypothetical protein